MSGRPRGGGRQVMVPPINIIFKTYQSGTRVSIWLYETLGFRIEGQIMGFDEFMNLVVKDAVKVATITKNNKEETREPLGQILLKETMFHSFRTHLHKVRARADSTSWGSMQFGVEWYGDWASFPTQRFDDRTIMPK